MPEPTYVFDHSPLTSPQKDILRPYVKDLMSRQMQWEEVTIKSLIKPWQLWLLIHTKSRLLVRLTGINRRSSHSYKDGAKTIEIWQHGKLKARSVWRITPSKSYAD